MDRGACQATVHGIPRVRYDLVTKPPPPPSSFYMFSSKEYNQSHFSTDHLLISTCRVISCVVGRGCLLWLVHSLGKTVSLCLATFCYSKAKLACNSSCLLTSYFYIPVSYDKKDFFFLVLVLEGLAHKGSFSQSCFSSRHVWTWELDHKKAECQRIDVFKLWCWRRLLRVPWTARRSIQ